MFTDFFLIAIFNLRKQKYFYTYIYKCVFYLYISHICCVTSKITCQTCLGKDSRDLSLFSKSLFDCGIPRLYFITLKIKH